MINARIVFALALLICGCTSSQKMPWQTSSFEMTIDSVPPRARIEIDSDTIGNAPCVISVKGHGERISNESFFIKAYPVYSGSIEERYVARGARIPKRLVIDTSFSRTPAIEVNLNTQ